MQNLAISAGNLLIMLGILGYKLKGPFFEYVRSRHFSIKDELETAQLQLRLAQEKYQQFSGQLKAVDAEISTLREQSRQESAAMKQRIQSEARRLSILVVTDARNTVEGIYSDFRGSLYSEFADLVLDRAEKILVERLTPEDRNHLEQEFTFQVENSQ